MIYVSRMALFQIKIDFFHTAKPTFNSICTKSLRENENRKNDKRKRLECADSNDPRKTAETDVFEWNVSPNDSANNPARTTEDNVRTETKFSI